MLGSVYQNMQFRVNLSAYLIQESCDNVILNMEMYDNIKTNA